MAVDWNGMASQTWPSGNISMPNAKRITAYGFYKRPILQVDAPNVCNAGGQAFKQSGITSINAPLLMRTGKEAFYGTGKLNGGYFPSLLECNDTGGFSYGAGSQLSNDVVWVFPSLRDVPNTFFRESKASVVDFGPYVKNIGTYCFYNSAAGKRIKVLILRYTGGVVTCSADNSISQVTSGNGTKVYVPAALIDTYKATSPWSAKGDIFYPIEGSEYEHYYANGVPLLTPQTPQFSLTTGTFTGNRVTVEVLNRNTFTVEKTAVNNVLFKFNLSDLSANDTTKDDNNTAVQNHSRIYSLENGGLETILTYELLSGTVGQMSVYNTKAGGTDAFDLRPAGALSSLNMYYRDLGTDWDIGGIGIYLGRVSTLYKIKCTLEIWNNGIKIL